MSQPTWAEIERLCFSMMALLLQRGVSLKPVPLPESSEREVDNWIRAYARGGAEFVFPDDPLVQCGLFARLKAGHDASAIYAREGKPVPVVGLDDLLEAVLIAAWYGKFREMWLGEASKN